MFYFLQYWYISSPARFLHSYSHTVQLLEGTLGVKATALNIGKPLYQDYTLQGRIVGVMIRLARILSGAFLYFLLGLGWGLLYVIWLVFPLICLVSLTGSVFGNSSVITEML